MKEMERNRKNLDRHRKRHKEGEREKYKSFLSISIDHLLFFVENQRRNYLH